MRVLVTGATGYIGGRLIPILLERGHNIRVLVRDPNRLKGKPWASRVDVFSGDLTDVAETREALAGIDAAYYLVHSMCSSGDFAAKDRDLATTFAEAADGIRQIIYLAPSLFRRRCFGREDSVVGPTGMACTQFTG